MKTGVDQGVEFVVFWILIMLRAFLRGRGSMVRTFLFTMERYRQGFQKRLRKLKVPPSGECTYYDTAGRLTWCTRE